MENIFNIFTYYYNIEKPDCFGKEVKLEYQQQSYFNGNWNTSGSYYYNIKPRNHKK